MGKDKPSDDKILLETIIYYCDEIAETLDHYGKDEAEFMENRHFQRDCAFSISQIGESSGKLSKELKKKYPEISWSSVSGIRNIIVHNYGGIELPLVWVSVTESAPALKAVCEKMLAELSL
jgi:uncharacterized protein with HEPN domain